MKYIVNIQTGQFTPLPDGQSITTSDALRVVEVDRVPTDVERTQILGFLLRKEIPGHLLDDPDPARMKKARRYIEMALAKHRAANGGNLVGFTRTTGVMESTIRAIDAGDAILLDTLEAEVERIRNSIGVGRRA